MPTIFIALLLSVLALAAAATLNQLLTGALSVRRYRVICPAVVESLAIGAPITELPGKLHWTGGNDSAAS